MQRLQDSAEERSSHGWSDMVEVVLGWWEGSHGVHGTGSPAQSQPEHLSAASKSGIAHVASKGTAQTSLPALNDCSGARFSPGNSFLSQAYSRLLCEMLPEGGNDLSFGELPVGWADPSFPWAAGAHSMLLHSSLGLRAFGQHVLTAVLCWHGTPCTTHPLCQGHACIAALFQPHAGLSERFVNSWGSCQHRCVGHEYHFCISG